MITVCTYSYVWKGAWLYFVGNPDIFGLGLSQVREMTSPNARNRRKGVGKVSTRALFKVSFRHLPGETEVNSGKPQSGKPQ